MRKCYSLSMVRSCILAIVLIGRAYAGTSADIRIPSYACGPFFSSALLSFCSSFTSPGPEYPPVGNLTAALVSNKEIQLQWEISDEKNILHFEVQHSSNGRSFSAVGIVRFRLSTEPAKGAYTFLHPNPVSGKNYYRIKTVYMDQSTEQSVIVPILYSTDESEKKEATLFPNPSTKGIVYFSARSARPAQYQLYVFDLDGKLVRQKLIQSNQTTILQQLKKGTYLFEIFKNDERIDSGQLTVR